MFHAADPRPEMQKYDTLSNAVYFVSVVNDKTPRILDALVDIAMKTEKADTIGRIAWGASDEKDELIGAPAAPRLRGPGHCREHDTSGSSAARSPPASAPGMRAVEVRARSTRRSCRASAARSARGRARSGARRLSTGCGSAILIMEKDALADFEEAAKDEDESVRRDVVRIVGEEWIWSAAEQSDPVIQLMLRARRGTRPLRCATTRCTTACPRCASPAATSSRGCSRCTASRRTATSTAGSPGVCAAMGPW